MSDVEFMSKFGEVSRALDYFDEPGSAVAARIHDLHRRHGETVSRVIDKELQAVIAAGEVSALDPDCVLRLAGTDVFGGLQLQGAVSARAGVPSLPVAEVSGLPSKPAAAAPRFHLTIDVASDVVKIAGQRLPYRTEAAVTIRQDETETRNTQTDG
jgi:hypothetical protein